MWDIYAHVFLTHKSHLHKSNNNPCHRIHMYLPTIFFCIILLLIARCDVKLFCYFNKAHILEYVCYRKIKDRIKLSLVGSDIGFSFQNVESIDD